MDPVTKAGLETLELAMRWAEARRILRRVLDSKKASEPRRNKARLDYRKLSDQLETATGRVTNLMKAAGQLSGAVKDVQRGQGVPWLKLMERAESQKKREQGLVAPADKEEDRPPWTIVIQQGKNQLPPLFFGTDKEAEAIIRRALSNGLLRRTVKHEHEYVAIQTGPGTVYMLMSTGQYEEQQQQARLLAARMMQQRQEQQQAAMRQMAQMAGGVMPKPAPGGPLPLQKGPLIIK